MTCKDCLSYEVCYAVHIAGELKENAEACKKFQSKVKYLCEFCNELIKRLNESVDRYVGECSCNGLIYPENEYFNVDDIYEVIDRILDDTQQDTVLEELAPL